jgi:hypothetical protein
MEANESNGLMNVAATPPKIDDFRNLRRENVVMSVSLWYGQTYKNMVIFK